MNVCVIVFFVLISVTTAILMPLQMVTLCKAPELGGKKVRDVRLEHAFAGIRRAELPSPRQCRPIGWKSVGITRNHFALKRCRSTPNPS
jgi:hypothetical protein